MKILPTTFTKNGFIFTQRLREGNIAIYGKRRANWKEGVETFEIVKIAQNPAWEAFDKVNEAAESYPCSNDWGKQGWSEPTLERARVRLASLGRSEASKCLESHRRRQRTRVLKIVRLSEIPKIEL